ncbi:LOW QUALITY PROTEIN: cobalamin trafficking protein CblD-like [Haliotis rubra]|uniref:LOW QUALITY PROTEIN: cobalamin trafficking protein CblD-like n=1 Tax=Haliotis rubra TaxID=36100 RepID=UPI001EE5A72D|nr:LOW QUALITY PROTEIN: cobalamin trafficking protein CblD-like [Haliotis rubra]
MAAQLLIGQRRVVAYLPCVQAAVGHFRKFSSHNKPYHTEHYIVEATNTQTVWPDTNLGPFGPQDRRFPLPGLVGTNSSLQQPFKHQPHAEPDRVLPPLAVERHYQITEQFIISSEQIEADSGYLKEPPIPTPSDMLECVAQDCPHILRKDFTDLFPGHDIMEGAFTVITISQRTQHDMTGWSTQVDIERETLLATFIQGATEICDALQQAGYWADFIDPSCGKPYRGPHTNSSLFETDERYRKLGFEIEDLGCCKVIQHHLWGTHAYVGCLFTNAPLDHPVIQQMQQPDKS